MQEAGVQERAIQLEVARSRGLGRRDLEEANLTIALAIGRAHACAAGLAPETDAPRMKIAFDALAYGGGDASPALRAALAALYDLPHEAGHPTILRLALIIQHYAQWTDRAPAGFALDDWRFELDDIATTFRFALQLQRARRYRGAKKQYECASSRLLKHLPHLRA